MKKSSVSLLAALAALAVTAALPAQAQIVTQWTFDNQSSGTNLTPTAATGTGSASTLGMVNNYASGNTSDVSDLTGAVGTDTTTGYNNTAANNQEWRVRGTNGWNSAAAIGTQGAQFLTSTTGYSNISVSFDIDISTQGEANVQLEYTTDGTTWTNATLTYAGGNGGSVLSNTSATNPNIVSGSYLHTTLANPSSNSNWFNEVTANLTGISGVNDDPNFGFRIVNAATGTSDVALKTSQGQINNTSGNWRFDDVTVTGTAEAVPEPNSGLLGACALGLFVVLLARRRSGLRA